MRTVAISLSFVSRALGKEVSQLTTETGQLTLYNRNKCHHPYITITLDKNKIKKTVFFLPELLKLSN